jgi:hypothetical protein
VRGLKGRRKELSRMNKQEIFEMIESTQLATFSIPGLGETTIPTIELKPMVEAWERSAEPTASEFLQKAKAICKSMEGCSNCPIRRECKRAPEVVNESDLVHKVMNYQVKEDKDAERN